MIGRLPSNWVRVEIGAICKLTNGRAFKPREWAESGLPIVRIQNLRNPNGRFNHFSGEVLEKHRIDSGALLFSWSGTPGTSFGAHIWEGGPAVLNQHIFRIDVDERYINKKYLRLAINEQLTELIASANGGVGLRHITKGVFERTEVPLPPKSEQDRIVETVEQSSAIQVIIRESIQNVRVLQRDLTKSIILSAVAGELTVGWQQQKRSSQGDKSSTAEVPPGWRLEKIGAIGRVQLGRQRSPKYHSGKNMRPYLRVANVFEDRIDVSDIMRMNFSHRDYEAYRLYPGDVLLNEGQSLELVGRPAIFRNEIPEVCFTNTLIRFQCSPAVLPEFALLVFRHYFHSGVFRGIAKITTNLAHLGAGRFSSLDFPLPPISEQEEIVKRTNRCLAVSTTIAGFAAELHNQQKSMQDAVFKSATSGQLVPQKPDDEPASVLLKRIRASSILTAGLPKPRGSFADPNLLTRSQKMAKILSVVDALRASGKPLSSQQLFHRAGYPEDAPTDQVESFFLDVRAALSADAIRKTRKGDQDVFELSKRGRV